MASSDNRRCHRIGICYIVCQQLRTDRGCRGRAHLQLGIRAEVLDIIRDCYGFRRRGNYYEHHHLDGHEKG